jgi:hypothetical protein
MKICALIVAGAILAFGARGTVGAGINGPLNSGLSFSRASKICAVLDKQNEERINWNVFRNYPKPEN